MALKIFLATKADQLSHERDFFSEFYEKLLETWHEHESGILIGSPSVGGHQIDALLVKSDAIIVIDFKNFGGDIVFSENGPWKTKEGIEIKGGAQINPYIQIRKSKWALNDFLTNNGANFLINNSPDFKHISGIILFHKKINIINKQFIDPKISSWLKITDIEKIAPVVQNRTSPKINLTEKELIKLISVIGYDEEIKVNSNSIKYLANEKALSNLEEIYKAKWNLEMIENNYSKVNYSEFYFKIPESGLSEISKMSSQEKENIRTYNETNKNTIVQSIEFLKSLEKEKLFFFGSPVDELIEKSSEDFYLILQNISTSMKLPIRKHFKEQAQVEFTRHQFHSFSRFSKKTGETFLRNSIVISNSEKIIPLLFSLRKYLYAFFSSDIFFSFNIKRSNFLFDIKFVSILHYAFEKDIKHIAEKAMLGMHPAVNGHLFCRRFELPEKIIQLNKRFLSEFENCFADTSDYHNFITTLGITFLADEQIAAENFRLVESKSNCVFHFGKTLNFINSPILSKFREKEPRIYSPIYIEILNKLDNELLELLIPNYSSLKYAKSKIDLEVQALIDDFETQKKFYSGKNLTALNIASRYKGMRRTYYLGFKKDRINFPMFYTDEQLNTYLTNNIPKLKSIEGLKYYCHLELSKSFYEKMLKELVLDKEEIIKNLIKENNSNSSNSSEKSNQVVPTEITMNVEKVNKKKLFGYEDVKDCIKTHLAPITDPDLKKRIKISEPDGIILYGPPGCGKTYFAEWIANYLNYEFVEVPRSSFGSPYVDGALINLKKNLDNLIKKSRQVVFFDEFDSIAIDRTNKNIHSESEKVVNELLQQIPKITAKGNLIVAATNFLFKLDSATIRSGRFGCQIPIFPPNAEERKVVLEGITLDKFPSSSPLLLVIDNLVKSNPNFWQEVSRNLFLFSNADLESLARKISLELNRKENDFSISDVKRLSKSITPKCPVFLDFFSEVQKNNPDFKERIELLFVELVNNGCISDDDKNERTPVGFKF